MCRVLTLDAVTWWRTGTDRQSVLPTAPPYCPQHAQSPDGPFRDPPHRAGTGLKKLPILSNKANEPLASECSMALKVEDRVQFILSPTSATQDGRKEVMEIKERLSEWALNR